MFFLSVYPTTNRLMSTPRAHMDDAGFSRSKAEPQGGQQHSARAVPGAQHAQIECNRARSVSHHHDGFAVTSCLSTSLCWHSTHFSSTLTSSTQSTTTMAAAVTEASRYVSYSRECVTQRRLPHSLTPRTLSPVHRFLQALVGRSSHCHTGTSNPSHSVPPTTNSIHNSCVLHPSQRSSSTLAPWG